MSKQDSTKDNIGGSVDYVILVIILGLVIGYNILNVMIKDITEEFNAIDIIELSLEFTVIFTAFVVAKRYGRSEVFGKAYLALGIAFSMWLIAEIMWQIYENVLFEDPYPSYADIFYFGFYPFAIYHMIKNIRFFQPKFSKIQKIMLVIIPISIIAVYSDLALIEWGDANFDFYYTLIFVSIASISIPFTIIGVQIFNKSAFAVVWSLLALGLLLHVFADIWYYYLEIFGQYTDTHIVNSLWNGGWMIIIYSLYKHRKIL